MPALNVDEGARKPMVLIPEKLSLDGLALLAKAFEVHQVQGLSPDQLLEIISEYDALIVRSETKVTAQVISAAKNLKVVARAGVGVDNVDVGAATRHGIIVVNSPSGNINAAAEHTIALLMAVARNIGNASISIKSGKWERSKLVGFELKGKSLGIIGLGKVGLTVARIATGLGMKLIAYDPYANKALAAAASVKLLTSLTDLLEESDIVTIHTPLIASTRGLIGAKELKIMKRSARILNVARGGTIDEAALLEALDNGQIAGAGVDVFTSEPPEPDSSAARLAAHPKVVATPHLGASTVEAQENVSIDVCTQVLAIMSGQLPQSAVNAPLIPLEEFRTLGPLVILLEQMGSLYTQYYSSHSTVGAEKGFRTTFDVDYEGSLANLSTTKPLFAALVKGLLKPISSPENINVNIVNAELIAKERGILVNERRSRGNVEQESYSSSVTVRARSSRPAAAAEDAFPASTEGNGVAAPEEDEQVISGFVSQNIPFLSRIGRFSTRIVPQGTLLICRNYDSCGRIGFVGSKLGEAGVNIKSMTVAPLKETRAEKASFRFGGDAGRHEALMILSIDKAVGDDVVQSLVADEGVLEVSVVEL